MKAATRKKAKAKATKPAADYPHKLEFVCDRCLHAVMAADDGLAAVPEGARPVDAELRRGVDPPADAAPIGDNAEDGGSSLATGRHSRGEWQADPTAPG